MGLTLLGTKLGMTRVFDEKGVSVPVTVIEVGPCVVTQVKTEETDGYTAVQIGYGDMKPRNSTMPMIGHDGKARTGPKRHHREFRVGKDDLGRYQVGQELKVDLLMPFAYVDVAGISKGKGFQGTMKRHNFKGMAASHGTERKHRSPGSIGSRASNRGTGTLKRGIRMAGHMGHVRVTTRSLDVVKIIPERNLLLVKGSVPGPVTGVVEVRNATRLFKSKSVKQAEKLKAAG